MHKHECFEFECECTRVRVEAVSFLKFSIVYEISLFLVVSYLMNWIVCA